jgi:chloramphenicol-sensitive protein RarD
MRYAAAMTPATTQTGDSPSGFLYATSAYLHLGLPAALHEGDRPYPTGRDHRPSHLVVHAHRGPRPAPCSGAPAIFSARSKRPAWSPWPRVTAALISINWGVYVWAIANDRALDAALGYYINPLFSVALGALLLRERLAGVQWLAVGLAAVAVTILTLSAGVVPMGGAHPDDDLRPLRLLAQNPAHRPQPGLLARGAAALPTRAGLSALARPLGPFHRPRAADTALLLGTGAVTAIPLMLYANGAKGLRLSTIGILQYIAPTMIFLIAVFVFAEPFGPARAMAFPLIWAALVLYTGSMIRTARAARA